VKQKRIMALTVTHKVEEGFGILHLAGSLTLGPSLNVLREVAKQVLASGKLNGLILQVGDVTSVDSAGLGELTIVYNFANRQRLGIRLVGSTQSLLKMLDMTRLEELLPPAKDMPSAKRELLGK
jgi:anti-sigma B factor antagonist